MARIRRRAFLIGAAAAPAAVALARPATSVQVVRAPHGGLQPQAVVDGTGAMHLIWFLGDPAAGDLWYSRQADGAAPTTAIRVNSTAGSAVAIGTIRGGQLAVDGDGRPHVVWNGSQRAAVGPGGSPMLYARLAAGGQQFEPERNLVTWAGGLDGGGTVAAGHGTVMAFWHALADGRDEASRSVFAAVSHDGGRTFLRERRISARAAGACACCGMKAMLHEGRAAVLYRAARERTGRDTILLEGSPDGPFTARSLQPWKIDACPMSSFALAARGSELYAAWETESRVWAGGISGNAARVAAPQGAGQKHPALACSQNRILLAWVEGTGWARGGVLKWQLFDRQMRPLERVEQPVAVPAWSLASAFSRPNDTFTIVC